MSRNRFLLCLVFAGVVLAAAQSPAGATTPRATIRGKVFYPDGRPAPGINLVLYPHTGQGLDRRNLFWSIPNYEYRRVTTDQNGEFIMAGVTDYPENKIHRYALFADGPTKFYHGVAHVILGQSRPLDQYVEVRLQKATVIRIKLKDRSGKPFNGTRAVYVQSGVLGQDVTKGISYVTEVNFVNGVGEWGPVVIKDKQSFAGRVAILDFPNEQYAKAAMKERAVAWTDNDAPLRWASRNSRGQALDRSPRFNPGDYTDLEFSLQ